MLAVIFEVVPHPERCSEYLDIAAQLKSSLEKMTGFISVERFESLSEPGKILSLSYWRDEAAIREWRKLEQHRLAQSRGRAGIFIDYHLRVARILRDYSLHDREQAPADSRQAHEENPDGDESW